MRRVVFTFLSPKLPEADYTGYDALHMFLPRWEVNRAAYLKMDVEKAMGRDCYAVTVSFVPTEGMDYSPLFTSSAIEKMLILDGLACMRMVVV